MGYLEKLYSEYSKWVVKAQEYYHAKDKLMPKAQRVTPDKELEPWTPTEETLAEIERLEKLYQEAENRQREIMAKIATIKSGKRGN
jgi:hypothetical protein